MILDFGFRILDCVYDHRRTCVSHIDLKSKIQDPKSKISRFIFCFIILLTVAPAFAQRQAQLPWWDRAAERWIGPYWIKSDLPPEQINAIGRHLNFMHREYGKALAGVPVRVQEKLNVLIFSSRDEWAFELRTRYAINPPEEGGWFKSPTDEFLAFFIEDRSPRYLEQLVQREGFKQFAYNRFGEDLPLWIGEGLAELFNDAAVFGDAMVFGQTSERALTKLKSAIESGKFIPFITMLDIDTDEWKEAQTLHSPWLPARQAQSMVMFVMRDAAASEAFNRLLRHLNNGLPLPYAYQRTLGLDAEAMERAWVQFVAAQQPSALATALERIEFLAAGALELANQKMLPQTLDALRSAFVEIKFTHTVNARLETYTMSAEDGTNFEIPKDAISLQKPVFTVSKSRLPPTMRERALERDNPTPPAIGTQHLRPVGVQVKWVRDEDNKSFAYQIILR